jgi:putative phosphoribosyl transferase
MLFQDRYDAALKLIPYLEKYKKERGVVLAVPRGGVPIGYYIAKNYNMPLELLLTKKIGHPWSSELAIGAVSLENYIIDERLNIPESYIRNEVMKIQESLHEKHKQFLGDRKPVDLKNKIIIIVDDGIATGNTILAAINLIREKQPKKIVVAVPVAPPETAKRIRSKVDDFICLYEPEEFYGVSQFYVNFPEVNDEQVIGLLKEANRFGTAA